MGPASSQDPLTQVQKTTFSRDAFGNVTQILEEPHETFEGEIPPRLTTITYGDDGIYPLQVTNTEGHVTESRFDKRWGVPISIKDPNGVVVQQAYDGFGHLAESSGPTGSTLYDYESLAHVTVPTPAGEIQPRVAITVDRQGSAGTRSGRVIQELDNYGRPVRSRTEGFGGVDVLEATAYDKRGRVVAETLAHTADSSSVPTVHYTYDISDRPTRIEHPDGSFVEHQYARGVTLAPEYHHWIDEVWCSNTVRGEFCASDIRLSTDETGRQNVLIMDHRGRVVRSIDGENVATAARTSNYRYGGFNRLREARDNGGNLSLFEYDGYGRLIRHTDPDSGATTYEYNAFDEMVSSQDPSGRERTYHYDRLGRMTSIVDSSGVTQWIYDEGPNGLGRLSETIAPPTAENSFGQRERYTYDPRGLLARFDAILDGTEYPVSFSYDDLGRPERIHYPNEGGGQPVVVQHTYSPSGILTGLDEVGGTPRQLWRMEEAFQGHLLARESFGNGAATTYGYHGARRWLTTIETTLASEQIQAHEYTYFENGLLQNRMVSRAGASPVVRAHHYDALNRLSYYGEVQGSTLTEAHYAYDHLGNLVERGDKTIFYNQNRPHLPAAVGINLYGHDANGNVTTRVGPDVPGMNQTIQYTHFDLPRTITSGGVPTHFEYSAGEKRVVRRDVDRARHFVGEVYQRLVSAGGDTMEERFRLFAEGRLLGEIVRENGSDRTLFFHKDHQGSVDTVSDSAGDAFAQAYDPWGDPLSTASGTALSLTRTGYTAHQHDTDLGLVDMRGRVYDPLAARFMTPDPVMQAPYWSQGLNRYAYVFNDPVNNTDPSGFTAARDAAAMYAPFHVGAGMTAYAMGSGLGLATGGFGAGRTLLGSGLGGGRASTGTQTVTPMDAPAGEGYGTSSPHAYGQNKPSPILSKPPSLCETSACLAENTPPPGSNLDILDKATRQITDTSPTWDAIGEGMSTATGVAPIPGPGKVTAVGRFAAWLKRTLGIGKAPMVARSVGAAQASIKLTGKAKRILGGIQGLKDVTVREAIRSRGGTGQVVRKAGDEFAGQFVGSVANEAARGNQKALDVIKLIKDAGRLGQKI